MLGLYLVLTVNNTLTNENKKNLAGHQDQQGTEP